MEVGLEGGRSGEGRDSAKWVLALLSPRPFGEQLCPPWKGASALARLGDRDTGLHQHLEKLG